METEAIKTRYWLTAVIFLAFFLAIPVAGFLLYPATDQRGQWGDFFGGTLNPLLTFLTFVGLLYTIFLQQKELRLSREELALTREELKRSSDALESQNDSLGQQRFENTLFSMIGVLNQIIEKMDVPETRYGAQVTTKIYNGRDCFTLFESRIRDAYKYRSWNSEPYYDDDALDITGVRKFIEYPHDRDRAISAYEHFYKSQRSDLGHYFRVLYNIFAFIKKSKFSDEVYPKILRAQLSNQELFVIFYNCLTAVGEKFSVLAQEFRLFDNLEVSDLIQPEHVEFVSEGAFGTIPGQVARRDSER